MELKLKAKGESIGGRQGENNAKNSTMKNYGNKKTH